MKTEKWKFETPSYIFDTDILAQQIGKLRKALGNGVKLCYAMKANPFVIKELEGLVNSFEVCSPGEFSICERAGIKAEQTVLSGVYKSEKDMEYVMGRYGNKPAYTVESLSQWQLLKACAQKYRTPVSALLRLTSGNQFGMNGELIRRLVRETDQKWISIEGLQYYSGTQKKSAEKLDKEISGLEDFCRELKEEEGFAVKIIEYGPGLPIPYFEGDAYEPDSLLEFLAKRIKHMNFNGSLTLEMGRFIAAPCGFYVTAVADTKINNGVSYCILDGGIHHLNYYGQTLAMKKPPVLHLGSHDGPEKEWTVCGCLCTAGDVLIKQYPFKNLQPGDQLVFLKTGAYSMTEGISLFLSRDLPSVFLHSSEKGFIRMRNSFPTNILNSNTKETTPWNNY